MSAKNHAYAALYEYSASYCAHYFDKLNMSKSTRLIPGDLISSESYVSSQTCIGMVIYVHFIDDNERVNVLWTVT